MRATTCQHTLLRGSDKDIDTMLSQYLIMRQSVYSIRYADAFDATRYDALR